MTGTVRAVWVGVMGVLAAGVAVLALGIRYDANLPAIVGFGLGVAVVGFVLSVGMLGWVYLSDADGDSLYLYPASVTSSSLLLFVSVDSIDRVSTGDGGTTLPLTLVAAALLMIVGMSLVFVDQIRAANG
jgi:hypothetical protein